MEILATVGAILSVIISVLEIRKRLKEDPIKFEARRVRAPRWLVALENDGCVTFAICLVGPIVVFCVIYFAGCWAFAILAAVYVIYCTIVDATPAVFQQEGGEPHEGSQPKSTTPDKGTS